MASSSSDQQYPDYLNPFGSDEEIDSNRQQSAPKSQQDDYPDHLSPFGEGEIEETVQPVSVINEYDDSLNPFGSDEDERPPVSLEPPPVPLPRTKSLLKKEQALRARQQQQNLVTEANNSTPKLSDVPANSSSPSTTTDTVTNDIGATGSFQRKKNKRNAPPVPINFKRQVLGSLDAIEEELNEIGDKLAIIDKESNLCQQSLEEKQMDESNLNTSRSKLIELIKRKNSIVKRQKELMYRKRELKLDQIHSDIEYELRMIGNKQVSHRTAEDDQKEKELLKKLVEIVEEKSDIVENLNKDTTSADNQEIEDALRKLNIDVDKIPTKNASKDCDTGGIAIGAKISKLATLLPKSGTIKGTMKIKRKRLFKKGESRSIER